MGKLIKIPAGSKINSVRLRLANNGGVIVCIEYRTPSIGKGAYDGSFDYAPDYELAFTTYGEAKDTIEEAAVLMGAKLEMEDDEDYDLGDDM